MTDNTYNGWTNRETWACNLWITNDQGLYEMFMELAHDPAENWNGRVSDLLKARWEELTDPDEGLMEAVTILGMVRDIGDEDKIDWSEIAEGLLSE